MANYIRRLEIGRNDEWDYIFLIHPIHTANGQAGCFFGYTLIILFHHMEQFGKFGPGSGLHLDFLG